MAMREMQIKTTLRFHLTPIPTTRIPTPRTPPVTNVGKNAGKKEPSYTAGGNVN
jgi:hypothetical protein